MDVKRRLRLFVGWVAAVAGLLTVLSPFFVNHVQVTIDRQWDPTYQLPNVIYHIQRNGISPELNDLLAQGPKLNGWLLTYVTDAHPLTTGGVVLRSGPPTILAASRPELVGKTPTETDPRGSYASGATVTAPGGTPYTIWMAGVQNRWPEQAAIGTAIAVAVLAWLLLSAWIYLDVRDTGTAPAWGWLLLGLLSGPVALAVWLIYRYTQGGSDRQLQVCPGCGADTVRGAAFCVRCGHGLRPSCPDCRRPVEVDWAYCGTCGSHLSD